MAYLGRPGATAPLTSADIPDSSITAAKIATGAITAADVAADMATQAELDTVSTVASAALPKAGGAMTGAITTNSTFDGIDIAVRDALHAPKASPTFTGTATFSGDIVPSAPLSHRNMMINGAMNVAQRGTSVTNNQPGLLTCDRVKLELEGIANDIVVTQDGTGPDGFRNSYKLVTTVNEAMATAGDLAGVNIRVEAQDLQQLAYGTSSAKTTTLSFYVKTNLAGTYAVCLRQSDNSDKINAQTYVVSSGDASSENWVRYSITIPGDTSGVINDDNGDGMNFLWGLGGGTTYRGGTSGTTWQTYNANLLVNQTVNTLASTSSYWQITGIQWELGSNATPFEHRSYGEELTRCQRYYQRYGSPKTFVTTASLGFHDATIWGWCLPLDGDDCATTHPLPVEMRTTPTASITEAHIELSNSITNFNSGNTLQAQGCSSSHLSLHFDTDEGLNTVNIIAWTFQSSAGYYDLSAEL